jgi:hypothetical protein
MDTDATSDLKVMGKRAPSCGDFACSGAGGAAGDGAVGSVVGD